MIAETLGGPCGVPNCASVTGTWRSWDDSSAAGWVPHGGDQLDDHAGPTSTRFRPPTLVPCVVSKLVAEFRPPNEYERECAPSTNY